ncbi:uncharacterized protein LOC132930834 [Rhopalosiphum padi]|uniref:uncharacterized protein LOC132930834 n=1 Tax=Rhopalosiphum padi TaxID=40932 RepID=UPI00298DAFA4|nr:uncharacterized protein LOC132930834 [Rhopalosiphum padi]
MVSQQLINPTVTQDLTNPTVTQNSTNPTVTQNLTNPTVTQNLTNPTVTQNLTTNNEVVHNWNKTVLEIDPNGLENPVSSFIRQWQVHNPFTYVKRNNCNPNDYCVLYGSVSHKMELCEENIISSQI